EKKVLIVIGLIVVLTGWWGTLESGAVLCDYITVLTVADLDSPPSDYSLSMGFEGSDIIPPDLSSPADLEYEVGSTNNWINWTLGDKHPHFYVLYKNSMAIANSSWSNGTMSFNVDSLSFGEYNLTIVVSDESLNYVQDTVWVVVVDTTPPTYSNLLQTSNTPNYNESVTVSVTVSDPSGVGSILLYYHVGSDSWIGVDCTMTSNYTFSAEMLEYNQVYEWFFWFNDSVGNTAFSQELSFTVIDSYVPDVIIGANRTTPEFNSAIVVVTTFITDPSTHYSSDSSVQPFASSTHLPSDSSVQPFGNVPSTSGLSSTSSPPVQPDLYSILSFVTQILRPVVLLVFLATLLVIIRRHQVH
ncbi:MAG: hypothetical protein ACFFCU_20935, partial [Promethearchaeota archaeon]